MRNLEAKLRPSCFALPRRGVSTSTGWGNLWHEEAPGSTKDDKRKNVTFIRTVSDDPPIGLTTSRLSWIERESEIRSNSVVDMAISK
jgi:hypothetical protein